MSFYRPNDLSNCFSQRQSDKGRCWSTRGPFGRKNGQSSLWGLPAAQWPRPDQGPINQFWQKSTHCIRGLQGDGWASNMLFVSPDNSQHLLSTQHQTITDLQGGRMGGRWPVSQVMDLPSAPRAAGPHEPASRGKHQLETEPLGQQNHTLFPLSEQQSFGQMPTKIPWAAWTGDPCVFKSPQDHVSPVACTSAFGFPASLGHKVRRDTKAGEVFTRRINKGKLNGFQEDGLSRLCFLMWLFGHSTLYRE